MSKYRLYDLKLLWRERSRVWRWYWYHRKHKFFKPYFKHAIRAVQQNPANADDWLMGEDISYE